MCQLKAHFLKLYNEHMHFNNFKAVCERICALQLVTLKVAYIITLLQGYKPMRTLSQSSTSPSPQIWLPTLWRWDIRLSLKRKLPEPAPSLPPFEPIGLLLRPALSDLSVFDAHRSKAIFTVSLQCCNLQSLLLRGPAKQACGEALAAQRSRIRRSAQSF